MASPPLVQWIDLLPDELGRTLVDRRQAMAAKATGRVLDLGEWNDHLASYPSGEVDVTRDTDDPGPFDTILSFIRTPYVASFDGYLDSLVDRLAHNGRIGFLEPVCRPGRGGGLLAISGRFARVGGLHLDRDIPHRVREHGLIVTDVDRFEVRSVAAPFRPFVEAWARRPIS
jgi:hypothetical protein